MPVDDRLLEALKLQWYAMDALNDKVELVAKALEGKGASVARFAWGPHQRQVGDGRVSGLRAETLAVRLRQQSNNQRVTPPRRTLAERRTPFAGLNPQRA